MADWKSILKERKEKKDASRIDAFKIPMGKTVLRVLPNKDDEKLPFWHDFGQHWVKNASGEVKSVPVCLKHTYEEACPYCEAVSEAASHIGSNPDMFDDSDIKRLDEVKGRHRILINAAVRDVKTGDYEIKLIELASTAFDGIVNLISEYDEIVSTKGGRDISIERSGAGINTKYNVMLPKAEGSDIDDSWKTEATDLAAFIVAKNVDATKAKIALDTVASLAGISSSISVASDALTAPTGAKALSHNSGIDSSLDDDLDDDDLDALDEVVETVVETEPSKELSSEDADLMSELDELDGLENL